MACDQQIFRSARGGYPRRRVGRRFADFSSRASSSVTTSRQLPSANHIFRATGDFVVGHSSSLCTLSPKSCDEATLRRARGILADRLIQKAKQAGSRAPAPARPLTRSASSQDSLESESPPLG